MLFPCDKPSILSSTLWFPLFYCRQALRMASYLLVTEWSSALSNANFTFLATIRPMLYSSWRKTLETGSSRSFVHTLSTWRGDWRSFLIPPTIDGRTAHCRLTAAKRYHALPPPLPKNFVFVSIFFLSRLGFHLRDADDGIVNYLLVLLDDEVFHGTP